MADVAELERFFATLLTEISEVRVVAAREGIDDEFREVVRCSREMHDLLARAMAALDRYSRASCLRAEAIKAAIIGLEELARMPDGKANWRQREICRAAIRRMGIWKSTTICQGMSAFVSPRRTWNVGSPKK